MAKLMKKSLVSIALLLATNIAIAQVPTLKKPVLGPQVKPAINPMVLKTPITVVNAGAIASNSPNREEAARRLKAQGVPAAAALAALRGAFGTQAGAEGQALRAAGYGNLELLTAIKQVDGLDASAMCGRIKAVGIPRPEWGPLLRQLYSLDFDALLATMGDTDLGSYAFGYALSAMGYGVEQMLQTGYRYFSGGFSTPHSNGRPYPGPGDMHRMLTAESSLAEQVRIDHYALFVRIMEAGYPPDLMLRQVTLGTYNGDGRPADPVSTCVASSNFRADDPRIPGATVSPILRVEIAPGGEASHSDAQRRCYVLFLEKIRAQRATLAFARQLANNGIYCAPATNPGCPARLAEVAERMVAEAGYPAEKN